MVKVSAQDRALCRLGTQSIPSSWKLSSVGKACKIKNELRLPLSVEVRQTMVGKFDYYGPTGVLGKINQYRADGEFALIGEDGDHFLSPSEKSQTIRVSGKFNVNNHAHLIASGEQCSVDWFFNFFRHRDISYSLTRQGAGRFKLTKEALKDLPILVPPSQEQHKIVEILCTWDEALEQLKSLLSQQRKLHQGLITSLVFGERQITNSSSRKERKNFRWFSLPDHWACTNIGNIANEVSERNTEGSDCEVLSCSKHYGFVRSLEYFKKQVFSSDLSGYKKIWSGDFGFPSNHVEEGSIGLQNLTDVGLVSPIYTVFRFESEKVHQDFAFAVLKTDLYRHIYEVSTSASVDRRGSLRWKDFSQIPFPLPPIEEQRAIADVLSISKDEISLVEKQITAIERQKRGLMQKLLTGEWRVDVEEADA